MQTPCPIRRLPPNRRQNPVPKLSTSLHLLPQFHRSVSLTMSARHYCPPSGLMREDRARAGSAVSRSCCRTHSVSKWGSIVGSGFINVPAGPCRYRNGKLIDVYVSLCLARCTELYTSGPSGPETSKALIMMPDVLMTVSKLEVDNEQRAEAIRIVRLTRNKRPLLFQ